MTQPEENKQKEDSLKTKIIVSLAILATLQLAIFVLLRVYG